MSKKYKIASRIGYVMAIFVIIFALLVSVGRLLTPYLNDHLPNFEKWATNVLHVPVQIRQVGIVWNVYEPEIEFKQVSLLNKDTHQPQFSIQKIKVNLNIVRSLLNWTPISENIAITGAHFTLVKTPSGLPFIEELKGLSVMDQNPQTPSHLGETFSWILTQPQISLNQIAITYIEQGKPNREITFKKLFLKNNLSQHELYGDAILHQKTPLHLQTQLKWRGPFLDFEHIQANLYFSIEGLSLPQWFADYSWQNLKIKSGVGSAKIWLTWDKNRFQQTQSHFQFYDLGLYSTLTQKTLLVPRLSGKIAWHKEADQDVWVGQDLLIDLQHHLWPVNQFKIVAGFDDKGFKKIRSVQTSYLDLSDIQYLTQVLDIFPQNLKQILMDLNPKGEIRNLVLLVPQSDWSDLRSLDLSFQFKNLSFQSWKNLPGLSHATGILQWNGKLGRFILDGQNTYFTYDKLLVRPLLFKEVKADLQWELVGDGSWIFSLKNLQANNADLALQTKINLTFPRNKSPIINLSGDFNVSQVNRLSDYLPLKNFEPELVKWLQNAFLKGQIESGKALIQGSLQDFPFNHGGGTFLVTGRLQNVDLHFNSKWPVLEKINGQLIFSGSSMTTEIASAHMLGAMLSPIRASIPSIGGKDPHFLTIQGFSRTDLKQGLKIINQSPLRETLGKTLTELNPQGPMQLNLALTIPLKTPNETKVQGQITLTGAKTISSLGQIGLDQLSGKLEFTETTIQGQNLTAKLLEMPAVLNVVSEIQPDKAVAIRINLAGRANTAVLQKLVHFPLENYAKGTTNYLADIHLPPRAQTLPTVISITSHLEGIELNLPGDLAKPTNVGRDLHVDIALPQSNDRPLEMRFFYNKILSGLFHFKKQIDTFEFDRGQLLLGGALAELPNKPGLFVGARFDVLEFDKLKPYLYFSSQTSSQSDNFLKWVRGFFLKATTLKLWGQVLNGVQITIAEEKKRWILNLISTEIIGQIIASEKFKEVQGRFQHFRIKSTKEGVGQSIDPRTLPAFKLIANNVQYNDLKLGTVLIQTQPSSAGMIIRQVEANDGTTKMNATGAWTGNGKMNMSRLQGKLTSSNINSTLLQWGNKVSSLVGSTGLIQFDLAWPDAFYNPSLKTINGSLTVNLGQGRIVNLSGSTEAKMGIGRVLSLFSLQSIPRRLSLDFSDLFQNGYSFDFIKGTFRLHNGNAYTNDLHLDGPVASVHLAGRIGFYAKDVALLMGVTTYVTSSLLPAAVGWLGGPITGVATLVMSAAMSHATSKVATYHYSITGPWSNPQWLEVNSSKIPR